MAINLVDIVELKYPGQIFSGNIAFRKESESAPFEIVKWTVPNVPQPLEHDLLLESSLWEIAHKVKTLEDAATQLLSNALDIKAQERKYKDANAIISYLGSSNPDWAAEARAFVVWRDSVYEYSINILEQIGQGSIPPPTLDEFIGGLPVMVWPS